MVDHKCHTLLIDTTLFPFGVDAGDEIITRTDDSSGPMSLPCQFYGVEEDTVYVRKNAPSDH